MNLRKAVRKYKRALILKGIDPKTAKIWTARYKDGVLHPRKLPPYKIERGRKK